MAWFKKAQAGASLRVKIIVLVSGLSVAAVSLSMLTAFFIELTAFRNRLMTEYQTTARMLASNLSAAVAFEDRFDSNEIMSMLSQREFVVSAGVYLEDGRLLAQYRRSDVSSDTEAPVPVEEDYFGADRILVNAPVFLEGVPIGEVVLRADTREMHAFRSLRIGLFMGLLAFATTVTVWLGARLSSALSRPIRDLAKTAQRITAEHDFSTRHTRVSEDETGRLVDAFNEMMAEIERRDDQIRRAKEDAEASSKAKDDFLSVISHELRTPLNPIIGYVEMMLRECSSKGDEDRLQLIKRSATHLLGLINDVLDYSRIERGVVTLGADWVDIGEMCEGVVTLLKNDAEGKGIELSYRNEAVGDERDLLIETDRVKLQQVLLNLVANAVKFTDRGSVKIRSTLRGDESERRVLRVEVEDTGIGVDRESSERIFDPFKQIDASLTREHGGLGLGLAISRKIVLAMNGEIACDSNIGEGSCFWFEVPLRVAKKEPPAPQPEASKTKLTRRRAGRILLVEDELVNRELARALLTSFGQKVVCATDGLDAVEKVRESDFDLIIMDIKMPRMNGFEAAKEIRKIEAGQKHAPIIAVTAHVTTKDKEIYLEAGMDDYLSKPFTIASLTQVIDKWLVSETGYSDGSGI